MHNRFVRKAVTAVAFTSLVVAVGAATADAHTSSSDGYGRSSGFQFIDRDHGRRDHGSGHSRHGHGGRVAPVVLTSGLNNPRQLQLVDGQGLLIAEAGSGGTACAAGPEGQTCVGATGSVSGVTAPQYGTGRSHIELLTGFLSGAGPDGSFAVGSRRCQSA